MKSALLILTTILAAAILVSAFNEKEALARFMGHAQGCQGKVGATKKDLEEIFNGQPASTKEGKCMRACVMKKSRFLNANGKLDTAARNLLAREYTDNELTRQVALVIFDTCAAIQVPREHCEAAEVYGKCFKSQLKKYNLI